MPPEVWKIRGHSCVQKRSQRGALSVTSRITLSPWPKMAFYQRFWPFAGGSKWSTLGELFEGMKMPPAWAKLGGIFSYLWDRSKLLNSRPHVQRFPWNCSYVQLRGDWPRQLPTTPKLLICATSGWLAETTPDNPQIAHMCNPSDNVSGNTATLRKQRCPRSCTGGILGLD